MFTASNPAANTTGIFLDKNVATNLADFERFFRSRAQRLLTHHHPNGLNYYQVLSTASLEDRAEEIVQGKAKLAPKMPEEVKQEETDTETNFANKLKMYSNQARAAADYAEAVNKLQDEMWAAMSPRLQTEIFQATKTVTPRAILVYLNRNHGTFTHADVERVKTAINSVRFSTPTNFLLESGALTLLFTQLEDMDTPMSAYDQCSVIRRAASAIPALNKGVEVYTRSHPKYQDQKPKTLLKYIRQHMESESSTNPYAEPSAAAHATQARPATAVTAGPEFEAAVAKGVAAALRAMNIISPAHTSQTRTKAYCWKHGHAYHSGKDCKAMQGDDHTAAHRAATSATDPKAPPGASTRSVYP